MLQKRNCEEQVVKTYLNSFSIDYDDFTPEKFLALIWILKKSKFVKNSVSRRGRRQSTPREKGKKVKEGVWFSFRLNHTPSS